MLGFDWSEIALIGVVALIFIGPKDMPTAIRTITDLLKKGRKLAGEFQIHVDDMVRDADLGEARDSLRQLRSLNLRGQVMKALDGDGALRRTLNESPLSPVPAVSAGAIPGAAPLEPVLSYAAPDLAPDLAPVSGADMLRRRVAYPAPPVAGALALDDAAPALIPPRTARHLARLRAIPPAPCFVPPSAIKPVPGMI